MFKYIFSFKFGNIHPAGTTTTTSTTSNALNAADKPVVNGGNNEETVKESPLIQSVRQQRRQQLEEMALIRKIAHQSFMSQYAVDHLPLSQVQEKLEEENLPLIQLQQKLKQTDDNLTVYTTTKENLRSLFYNQRRSHSLLMKSRKFRPTNRKDHHNNNNNNNVDDNSNPTKDDRDYDVWDDAVIGRIMNLVDTIGVEPGEAIRETHSTDEGSTFSANISGNAEEEKSDSKDRETIVAENVQEDCETQPVEAAEEATEYDEPDDHEGSTGKRNTTIIQVTTLTTTTSAKRPDGLTRHSSYGGSVISIESDNKRESGFWKRNSILSPSSFFNNKERNHSEFSGSDDDLIDRRSIVSVTSKASIDDFDNRDRKSIPFLKKLWKPKRQKDQINETSSNRLMKLKQYSSGSLSRKYYNQ